MVNRVGEFLVNLFVQADDRDGVAEAVKQVLRPAYLKSEPASELEGEETALYVAPSIRGWVGIFDLLMDKQDEALCEWVVRKLSGSLQTVAVSFLLHDGDFVRYWLAREGKLLDRYHSIPDYFGPVATAEVKRLQGRPTILADLCGKPLEAYYLVRLLRDPYLDGLEMLEEITGYLEIPNLLIGYRTVEEDGEEGWVEGWEAFRAVSLRELLQA